MKSIGITCDQYKVRKYRRGLLNDGYELQFDGPSGISNVHLFKIETTEHEFETVKKKVAKTIAKLELELKRSN